MLLLTVPLLALLPPDTHQAHTRHTPDTHQAMEGVAEASAALSEREAHYAQHEQLYLDCAVRCVAPIAPPPLSYTCSTRCAAEQHALTRSTTL